MSVRYAKEPTEKLGFKRLETRDLDESLVAGFERAEKTFPLRIALSSAEWELTYRELNRVSNRLAHRLVAGVAKADRVVILMSHDAPMIAATLGILKAGLIVVALDATDPVTRLKMIIDDVQPSVIVTDSSNRELATGLTSPACQLLNFELEAVTGPTENLSIEISPEQSAFLVYTSGTTGRPKGVIKTHRQICRGAAAHTDAILVTENDRIPLFASLSTGQGLAVFACTLLNGAMLCPFSVKTKGISELAQWIIDRELTIYFSSASIFRTFVKIIDDGQTFSKVRAVLLATESITADDFKAFRKYFPPESIFAHTLASSEASVIAWSRWSAQDNVPEGVLPVGHFVSGMDVSLLGDNGQPVARGEVGEIVIRSRYLANGYWRDPVLTAERFSADPDGEGTRLLRTGDLGRINANGLLELRGRKDSRIKIRGNRIELLDIERTLESLPGIQSAAAVAIPRQNFEPMLVTFVVKATNALWTPALLRHAAKTKLPRHMVPSRIVFLDSLPYRGNKIDREALRQYSFLGRDPKKGEKPQTETETLLADIWAEVLEVPDVSRDDDFFHLGGDSLRGAIVGAQVYAALGIELNLGAIADHPTIAGLAAFIDGCPRNSMTDAASIPPIVRVSRAESMPLSFFQEHIWFNCRNADGTHLRSHRIIGPLNIEILKECLSYLSDRYEILRTTFGMVEGHPAQIIHPSSPLDFSYIDLSGRDDPAKEADLIFREADSRAIDLEKLPIVRYVLTKIADNQYRLARITHRIMNDGLSARLLDAELAILYEAKLRGLDWPLQNQPSLQYADYAVWQRQIARPNSRLFNEAVNWWKNILSITPPDTELPFRRWIRRTGVDSSEGLLPWGLEQEQTINRLEKITREAGVTRFIVRLAAFVALIADVTDNSAVVITSAFSSRNRVETQAIVGPVTTMAPIVFSCDTSRSFLEWLEIVRDRVFETARWSDIPFDAIVEKPRASGVKVPESPIVFMESSYFSDQQFGDLTISNEFWNVGKMPIGCTFYLDRKPENCLVNFDANLYDPKGMRALLDRYYRLLEAAARNPELPITTLLTLLGAKPLRWKCESFYEFVKSFYDASSMLKMLWRPVKRWFVSNA